MDNKNKKKDTNDKDKKIGFIKTIAIFTLTFLIMAVVMGGTIYYILINNINGVTEKNKAAILKVPILRNILPESKDPDNPDNFDSFELKDKYKIVLEDRNKLRLKVEELNPKATDYDKMKAEYEKIKTETEQSKKQMETDKANIENEKKILQEDKKKFGEMVAKGDKKNFKEFYEKMDAETAKKVYEEVMKEQKSNDSAKQLAKIYETMEPASSAKILQDMGASNINLVVDVMKNLKKDTSSAILSAMDTKFAATLSEKLNNSYKDNP